MSKIDVSHPIHKFGELHAVIESAWEVETQTLKQTVKLYHPPLPVKSPRMVARAERPGKVKVFSPEEIQNENIQRGLLK